MRRRQSLEAGAGRGALPGPAHRMQFWDHIRGAQLAVGTCSRPQTAEQRLLLLATVGPGCATEPTTLQGSTSGTGGMGLGEDRSPGWPLARLREMTGDQRGCTRGPVLLHAGPPGHWAAWPSVCLALATHAPQGCLKDKGQERGGGQLSSARGQAGCQALPSAQAACACRHPPWQAVTRPP